MDADAETDAAKLKTARVENAARQDARYKQGLANQMQGKSRLTGKDLDLNDADLSTGFHPNEFRKNPDPPSRSMEEVFGQKEELDFAGKNKAYDTSAGDFNHPKSDVPTVKEAAAATKTET